MCACTCIHVHVFQQNEQETLGRENIQFLCACFHTNTISTSMYMQVHVGTCRYSSFYSSISLGVCLSVCLLFCLSVCLRRQGLAIWCQDLGTNIDHLLCHLEISGCDWHMLFELSYFKMSVCLSVHFSVCLATIHSHVHVVYTCSSTNYTALRTPNSLQSQANVVEGVSLGGVKGWV